ncbi:unnamed protein product, partial [Coregonus sp. 'balchen']
LGECRAEEGREEDWGSYGPPAFQSPSVFVFIHLEVGLNMLNSSSGFTAECDGEGNGSLAGLGGLGVDGSDGALHRALGVVLTVMLALVVFSLGCTVDGYPGRAAVPVWLLTAYLLILGFSVQPVQSVAIIFMGCCPGGVISNIITYWIEGDMDLSITMTTISTVLGLGMMPLGLYVYTYSWVGTVVGGLLLMVVGIAGAVLYRGSWHTDTSIIIIGAIFPLIEYSAWFIIAVIVREPWQ